MDAATRKKLLQAATNKLKKQYGDDVIFDVDDPEARKLEVISTGSLLLDTTLGVGGFPIGRIVECYGPNSSGKTSIAYSLCAQAQKQYPEKLILFIDAEHAADLYYMEQFGINTDSDHLIFVQPDSIEQSFNIMLEYAATGLFSLIILDSIGGSATEDILAKGVDELTMGSLAKKMSTGLTKLKNILSQTDTLLYMTNQIYAKMSLYGGNETKGGQAAKFYSSIRLEISKRDLVADEDDKEVIKGQVLKWKVVKNKVGQPYQEGETTLIFGQGFDQFVEIVELSIKKGWINQGGAWFSFLTKDNKEMKFQGKHRLIDYFRNSPEDFEYYKERVLESLKKQPKIELPKDLETTSESE